MKITEFRRGRKVKLNDRLQKAYGQEVGEILGWRGDPFCRILGVKLSNGLIVGAPLKEFETVD